MLTPETRTRRLLPGTIAAIDDLCESLEATDDPTAEASDWTEELNALHAVQAAPTVEVLAAHPLAAEELSAWAQGHEGEADAAAVEVDLFAADQVAPEDRAK